MNKRLKEYRESIFLNKREMAKKLDITEAYYNMLEKGTRKMSMSLLHRLVAESGKTKEFWETGLNTSVDENVVESTVKTFLTVGIDIDVENLLSSIDIKKDSMEEIFIKALKIDISNFINKHKK